jgi:predicted TIM-barrel fold metal-dependent hydrolase
VILDGHIHIDNLNADKVLFKTRLKMAGVSGGIVLSVSPDSFTLRNLKSTAAERLNDLLLVTRGDNNLYPFFWIDPLEDGALEQVKLAVDSGVTGFKVICNRFYPGDTGAIEVFRAIARHGKPILFHSGILWDGQPSSPYNRPAEFETLLDIEGLKFCLAHISWPWVDECIAVYGKFLNAYSNRAKPPAEMFIDITPGTPPIYREEALKKLFTVGYDIEDNIIFGSDCFVENYNSKWTCEWIKRDNEIYSNIGLEAGILSKIYSDNLLRFIGVLPNTTIKKTLKAAE